MTTNAKNLFEGAGWSYRELQEEWIHSTTDSSPLGLLRKRYQLRIESLVWKGDSLSTRPPDPKLQKENLMVSLHRAIDDWSIKECSDPRDRVAGLLGLVKPQESPAIKYTESVVSAYLETVLALMNTNSWRENVPPVYVEYMQVYDSKLHLRNRAFAFSAPLNSLANFMGLKSTLGKGLHSFLDALSEQAEQNWRLRVGSSSTSALNSRWLEALMYCHQCHRILFRTRGTWYECFHFLVALHPQKRYRMYGRIPVSGSRAHLPVREVVLDAELEKERDHHINLLKSWPCAKSQATIVEYTASLLLSYL